MDKLANRKIKITSSTVKNYSPGFQYSKTKFNRMRAYVRKFHTITSLLRAASINHFTPLQLPNNILTSVNQLATMDIETMKKEGPIGEIPVAITICLPGSISKIFLLNPNISASPEEAIIKLWKESFKFLINNYKGVVFMHNLGGFDGLFIYKYLCQFAKLNEVSSLIDDENKFIEISYKNTIIWKDSYRIFQVSLEDLCQIFMKPKGPHHLIGKLSKYRIEFNSFKLFNEPTLLQEFIDYSIRDSVALYEALMIAQDIYLKNYNVDITTICSTATLSLKIYRTNFLDTNIPTLNGKTDHFIRKGYFGGGTDYYKQYITNAKSYDINSLYPFAMCKPIPYEIIQYYEDMSHIKLENFFGYCLAEIYCPRSIFRPVLPYRKDGKTIYPTGQ